MRQIALVVLGLVTLACGGPDEPTPGSRGAYEPCEPKLTPDEELCGPDLACQSYLSAAGAYCAPSCSLESEDSFVQSSDCPEFDGFVSYCSQSPDALSCVIRCETACPEGLVCDEVLGRCFAQDES